MADRRLTAAVVAGTVIAGALLAFAMSRLKEAPEPPREPLPQEDLKVEEAGPVTEDSKRQAMQHYLSGVIFYQKASYDKAREEFELSLKLDPGQNDAKGGLERVKAIQSK